MGYLVINEQSGGNYARPITYCFSEQEALELITKEGGYAVEVSELQLKKPTKKDSK